MEALIYILLGAILVTYGWYWGGVTESRSTAAATAVPAAILAGATVFNPAGADTTVWALGGLSAIFGTLVALSAYWETAIDRTLGLYSLFFAVAVALVAAGFATAGNAVGSLAAIVLAGVFALIFISAALVPGVRGFRAFVGWVTLVAGALVAFLGFVPALGVAL